MHSTNPLQIGTVKAFACVVLDDEQHAGRPSDFQDGSRDSLCGWGRKNIARHSRCQHALPNIASVCWLMSRPTPLDTAQVLEAGAEVNTTARARLCWLQQGAPDMMATLLPRDSFAVASKTTLTCSRVASGAL